jgi:hypothetical protein
MTVAMCAAHIVRRSCQAPSQSRQCRCLGQCLPGLLLLLPVVFMEKSSKSMCSISAECQSLVVPAVLWYDTAWLCLCDDLRRPQGRCEVSVTTHSAADLCSVQNPRWTCHKPLHALESSSSSSSSSNILTAEPELEPPGTLPGAATLTGVP